MKVNTYSCETIQCFAASKEKFLLGSDDAAYEVMRTHPDESFKLLLNTNKTNIKIKPISEFTQDDILSIIRGETNTIAESYLNQKIMKITEYAEQKDDWIITAINNYSLLMQIIRKDHPKSEQMRRKINDCLEYGIIVGISKKTIDLHGIAINTLMFQVFDKEIIDEISQILAKKKTQNIALGDLRSIFSCLILGSVASLLIFFFEKMNIFIDKLLLQ